MASTKSIATISDESTLKFDAGAAGIGNGQGIIISADSILKIGKGCKFDWGAGGNTAAINGIHGGAGGTIIFQDGNSLDTAGPIGQDARLNRVQFGYGDGKSMNFGTSVAAPFALTSPINAITLSLCGDYSANAQMKAPVFLAIDANTNGVSHITGKSATLVVNDNAAAAYNIGEANSPVNIIFNDGGAYTLRLGAGGTQTIYGNISAEAKVNESIVNVDNPLNLTGDVVENIAAFNVNAATSFTGKMSAPVTIANGQTLTATGDTTFDSTVDGDGGNATIAIAGNVTFDEAVGAVQPLHQITIGAANLATLTASAIFNKVGSSITFDNNTSTLTIADGHTIQDLAEIVANGPNAGKLILAGQTIMATIGQAHIFGKIDVTGNVILTDLRKVTNVVLSTGSNLIVGNGANESNITNLTIAPGATNTTLTITDGDVNVGTIGAADNNVTTINFIDDVDHTLTVTGAIFADRITTSHEGKGTLAVSAKVDTTIKTNIGIPNTGAVPNLAAVTLTNTGGAVITYDFRGSVIGANVIDFAGGKAGDALKLGDGKVVGSMPQAVLGSITNNGGVLNATVLIAGPAAILGDIAPNISFTANAPLYVGKLGGGDVTIAHPLAFTSANSGASVVMLSGNLTLNGAVNITGGNAGSIIGSSITPNEVMNVMLAGAKTMPTTSISYTNTITIASTVGARGGPILSLIDAGTAGNVVLSGAGYVGVNQIKAKTLTLSGAGPYDVRGLAISNLVIAHNLTIPTGSILLGTQANQLEANVSFVVGGGRTLTVADAVNINVKEFLGANNNITFAGTSTVVNALGTSASKFDILTVNKSATFGGDIFANNLVLEANATSIIEGNATTAITGTDSSTVVAASASNSTITSVGAFAGTHIGTFNMNTTNQVTVPGEFAVQNLVFAKDGTLVVNTATTDITGAITQTAGNNAGTVTLKGAGNFVVKADIGTANNAIKSLQLDGSSMTIADHAVFGNVTTATPGSGSVTVGTTTSPNLNLGKSTSQLNSVIFNPGATATVQDIFAQNITLGTGTTTARTVSGTSTIANGGTLKIIDAGAINNISGAGTVDMLGSGSLGETYVSSPLAVLNLTASGNVTVLGSNQTIYATTVNHTSANLISTGSLRISGSHYNATNAALTMTNGSFAVISPNANLSGTFTVNVVSEPQGLVMLDFGNVGTLDIEGLTEAIINLNTAGNFPLDGTYVASIRDALTNAEFIKKLRFGSQNALVNMSIDTSGNITSSVNTTPLASVPAAELSSFLSLTSSESSSIRTALLNSVGTSSDPAQSVVRYENHEATQGAATQAIVATQLFASLVNVRVSDVVMPIATSYVEPVVLPVDGSTRAPAVQILNGHDDKPSPQANSYAEGVAAGNEAERFGVWANVIGGVAKQDQRKGNAGFNANLVGGVVGADTMVSENTVLGFALGNAVSNVKYKDTKQGDKAFSTSWIFATYGNYQIDNNWFVRGSLTAGSNAVTSKEKRFVGPSTMLAKSKYNMETYGLEASVGYNHHLDNAVLTPSVGVRGAYLTDISYTESGAGIQNRKIVQKASTSTTLMTGLQYATNAYVGGTPITPEAHVNLQYGFGMKSPKGNFKAETGAVVSNFVGTKPGAFSTNFGGSITASTDNVEYGVGYDLNLADKYMGHQGSLKLKVQL